MTTNIGLILFALSLLEDESVCEITRDEEVSNIFSSLYRGCKECPFQKECSALVHGRPNTFIEDVQKYINDLMEGLTEEESVELYKRCL